jgi:hypothetical protein
MSDGFLAIWSDIDVAAETDYVHWMSREHAIERVSIPGFLAMRFFRALHTDARRYMMLYELASSHVVGGADYLARLNNPTPWSQRIMPQLRNFIRGGGQVVAASGTGQGGYVAALPLNDMAKVDGAGLAASLAKSDRIFRVRVMATDHAQTAVKTNEKSLRTDDRSFDGLLVIEGLDEASVRSAAALSGMAVSDVTVYTPIFALDRRLL